MNDYERGRRIAKKLPRPEVRNVKGVNVVTQLVEGLTAHDLRALSEFYRRRYSNQPQGT